MLTDSAGQEFRQGTAGRLISAPRGLRSQLGALRAEGSKPLKAGLFICLQIEAGCQLGTSF